MQEIEFRNEPFERVMAMAMPAQRRAICDVCVCVCVCDDIVESLLGICALNWWGTVCSATNSLAFQLGGSTLAILATLAAQVWNVKCANSVCVCAGVCKMAIYRSGIVRPVLCAMFARRGCNFLLPVAEIMARPF